MEKVLKRLVVSPRPFTEKQIESRERMAEFISIPGVLRVQNEYRHVPGILNKLKLETNSGGLDLDEDSLKAAVAEPGYHNIHLTLTTVEWRNLGIRSSLYGQSQEIDGQGITYGRHGTKLKYYTQDIRNALDEITLVEWHELDHAIRALLDIDPPSTHYHFYGYAAEYKDMPKKEQNRLKPRRWVRKPDPLEAWRALPWERLPDDPGKTPQQTLNYLQQLLQILNLKLLIAKLTEQLVAQKPKLVKPLKAWGVNVSQKYGNYNPSLYPTTGHHIGVDHAVPKGTPVYAPADGELLHSGYTKTVGYYVVYKYAENRYLVAMHLQKHTDLKKNYSAGETLGLIGDTGFIIGIHSHIEVWTIPVDRAALPADLGTTWREVTRDPLAEF